MYTAPPVIDTFELQPKSSPISPPGVAVVRQDGDRHYESTFYLSVDNLLYAVANALS